MGQYVPQQPLIRLQLTMFFSRGSAEQIPPPSPYRRAHRIPRHVRAQLRIRRCEHADEGGEKGWEVGHEWVQVLVRPFPPSKVQIR